MNFNVSIANTKNMAYSKWSITNNIANLPYKKQCITVINHLCHELYPKYKSNESIYGFIKEII